MLTKHKNIIYKHYKYFILMKIKSIIKKQFKYNELFNLNITTILN